jgi:hypothetical protein
VLHSSIAMFPKNLMPWRDSNPNLMLRMRCPLRHATRGRIFKLISYYGLWLTTNKVKSVRFSTWQVMSFLGKLRFKSVMKSVILGVITNSHK